MSSFEPPRMPALVGPGSQPESFDGTTLDYMVMPSGMTTFSAAHVPEAEQAEGHGPALEAVAAILAGLRRAEAGGEGGRVDLTHLSGEDLMFVDQLLGEGEVSVVCGADAQAQESVLAGVWRVRECDAMDRVVADYAEIGAFPQALLARTFLKAQDAARLPESAGPNIFNAPALVVEINEHVPHARDAGQGAHSINLSLLPHTEEDLVFLKQVLGQGDLVILSRGYGNCRIHATGTRDTWWVRYYNSQDTLILNSIEVSPIPEVALAAREDLADSAERLAEILAIYIEERA
ncbi:hydrogenase expression/formation protein [Novosphingobium sp. 1949]|uniref:Hydrogenase expression/formation protein n=1 Tax=Novosphingobium organovorum TaxID=2930092 RepID=A0ABT0BDD5_9SPHN|nr:hydrogenase expression/formation protein [Novosphingobium organovorum]MCJ2182804.1 hydrogenase expression/formation protein [Novosphingobium organovorum]